MPMFFLNGKLMAKPEVHLDTIPVGTKCAFIIGGYNLGTPVYEVPEWELEESELFEWRCVGPEMVRHEDGYFYTAITNADGTSNRCRISFLADIAVILDDEKDS